MIEIRGSEGEVEVSGTVEELLEVAFTIRALVASSQGRVVLPAAPCVPAPYKNSVSEFAIARTSGATVVAISAERLEVAGSDSSLEAFASWFQFPVGSAAGQHNHFEPLPGDPYHSSESASLVVMVCEAGA